MPIARSSPNIAFIKYWGNRDDSLRLPAADSLSMVLDTPIVQIKVEPSENFTSISFNADGTTSPQSEKSLQRLKQHWQRTKTYLESIGKSEGLPAWISLVIRSEIPPAIGIASSAAVFGCLAEAYAALSSIPLTREEVSILGRLGSGSGARNSFGGFVALENHGEGMGGAYGRQIMSEHEWVLHDVIIVPSREEKKVGSTEGHKAAATSPLFLNRMKEMPRRMRECIDALKAKDFEKLRMVSEEDALDMHRVMETQNPPLRYLNDETHRIVREIQGLRSAEHLNVFFTMDAGPTVHLLCTEDALKTIKDYAESQKNCILFLSKTGSSSRVE